MQPSILFGAAERGLCLLSGALVGAGYARSTLASWPASRAAGPTFAIAEAQEWHGILRSGEARGICVFEAPGRTVAALLGDSPTDYDPGNAELTPERALAWWCSVHRDLIAEAEAGGEWLFLNAEDIERGPALQRVGEFLGLDLSIPTEHGCRAGSQAEVPAGAEAEALYRRLCELANQPMTGPVASPASDGPTVSVLAYVGPGEEAAVPGFLKAAEEQSGVHVELVILDHSGGPVLDVPGARVVPCPSPSRGAAWKLGAAHASGEYLAWWLPGCKPMATQLQNAVAQLQAKEFIDFVTCTHLLHDDSGEFVERIHPDELPRDPGPGWESGAVMRRSVLDELSSTAFFPVELELWRRLEQAGRCAHVMQPGFSLNRWIHKARWESSRLDVDLLAQAELPYSGDTPQLTVSICSSDNRLALRKCLEGYSRQILPRGSYEIVVVNAGSRDGTFEMLTDLELPVPCRLDHQRRASLPGARNRSLELAEGYLVLFAEDDTIPQPDHLGHHIQAHARRQDQGPCAVMGSVRHSQKSMNRALVRHMDGSHADFPPAFVAPNEFQAMTSFYPCPISLPTELVRLAGGFDTSYAFPGCEAADLWARVDGMGLALHYEPDAIVLRNSAMDFGDLRKRQVDLARAHVEFFRKNPQVLSLWGLESLTLATCEASVSSTALSAPLWEKALDGLCSYDIGHLERVGGAQSELAVHMLRNLDELLSGLNRVWWHAGYAEGMRQAGVESFAEFARESRVDDPIRSEKDRRLFAWPVWDDPRCMDRLLEWARPLAEDGFGALVLRLDRLRDPDQTVAFSQLEAAYARVYGEDSGADLEVLVEARALGEMEMANLCGAVDGVIVLGGETDEFLNLISCPTLASAEEVREWRNRTMAGEPQPALRASQPMGAPAELEALRAQENALPGIPAGPVNSEPGDPSQAISAGSGAPKGSDGQRPVLAVEPTEKASPTPLLSVIVPTHNRPKEIVQLVECLTRQDLDPNTFEVIVVDDGSRQPASQLLGPLRTAFDLQVISQPSTGPGAARNRGLEVARADMIVFFNDDAVPAPDCLRRHLEVQNASDGKHAVLGTFTLLPELVVDSFTAHVESSTALFAQPKMTSGTSYAGTSFCTGNLSVSRQALEAVGGFDESFRYAGGEDSELGLRLDRELGFRVLYDSSVVCQHDHELRLRGFLKRMRVIGWAAYRIEQKHGNTGLVQGQPVDEAGWIAMRELVEKEEDILRELLESAEDACRRERESNLGPVTLDNFRDIYDMIAGYGMRCGILAAHEGALVNLSDEVLAIAA